MTAIYTQRFIAGDLTAVADAKSLLFTHKGNNALHIAGLPPHVAEHTAAAFNRAMQAAPDGDGWTYTGLSGKWHISRDLARGTVYLAQHDEVTGDGDPYWMFTDAASLIACLDAIDATEDENCCSKCFALTGPGKLSETTDGALWCDDCLFAEAENAAAMREMAEDDMAHAAMERRAGL